MYSSLKNIQNLLERIDPQYRDYTLLTESQESKSIEQAKTLLMNGWGFSREDADKFVREDVRNTFSVLHHNSKAGKFILGLTRMLCKNQFTNTNEVQQINNIIELVASDAHINEYDRNLNDLTPQELINRFANSMKEFGDKDKEKLSSEEYQENTRYRIIQIDNFEQASKFSPYTSWCVTHDERMLNSYTSGGIGQFYFCIRDDFKTVPEQPGEGCPLDDYGLSMVAVSVNGEGILNTCTCRWNHSNGGNDHIMNTKQISQLIGKNFYDVFKPNNKLKEKIDDLLQRINDGDPLNYVFRDIKQETPDFAVVSADINYNDYDWGISNDWNIYNKHTKNFVASTWFEEVDNVPGTDKFVVTSNYRTNIITLDGKYVFETPPLNIDFLEYGGHIYYAINFGRPTNHNNTALETSYSLLDENFNKVTEENFDYLKFGSDNPTGKYVALIREADGGYNLIDVNGNRLYDKHSNISIQRFNGDNAAKTGECEIEVDGETIYRRCYSLVFSDGHEWKKWYRDIGFVREETGNRFNNSKEVFAVKDFGERIHFIDRYENEVDPIENGLSYEDIVWRRLRRARFGFREAPLVDTNLLANYYPT